jgi:RNA polymerase sigma factor (sigma-70 family)
MGVTQTSGTSGDAGEGLAWPGGVDRRNLVSAVSLICGDPVLAEEAMQEAMLRAWQKAKSGEPVEAWPQWILTVALNQTRDHFRRLRSERSALNRLAGQLGSAGDDHSERVSNSVDLVRAMRGLTRRQREVVTLFYRLDLPVTAIATTLGIEEGTVKTLLHRARTKLAPLVSERLPERGQPLKRSS